MTSRRIAIVLALIFAASVPVVRGRPQGPQGSSSRSPAASPADIYRRAVDAWEAGHYPDALTDLSGLMKSPAASEYLDRIALLTGELYTTTELTTDGRNPKIAPNGVYASFETGAGSATVTRIVRLAASRVEQVADLPGVNVSFDPGSRRVVYVRAARTPEWAAASAALDAGSAAERQTAQALVNFLTGKGDLVVRDLASGAERVLPTPGLLKSAPVFAADGEHVLFIGSDENNLARSDLYLAGDSTPSRLTDSPDHKTGLLVDPAGTALVYMTTGAAPFRQPGVAAAGRAGGRGGAGAQGRGAAPAAADTAAPGRAAAPPPAPPGPNPCGAGGGGRGGAGGSSYVVVDLRAKTTRTIDAIGLTMSADGRTLAWLAREGNACALRTSPTLTDAPRTLRTASRLDAPALSPDGKLVAYQAMTGVGSSTDWEIYVTDEAGVTTRVTRDIQHDVLPRFLTGTTLIGMMGEARHRRSQLYDLTTSTRTRIFANNTIRTISPEYIWLPSADGKRLLIQAERDGDTVSPERGVYIVDFARKVSSADVLARLDRQMAAETDLRQRTTKAFGPIADQVRRTIATISPSRAYEYEKAQFDFDSKYVSQPGNAKAIDYLNKTYTSFGYTPELQWFSPAQAQGNRTANVVATLKGTENPDLIYVVSSHFDSVQVGPGADDDTSGTCALLETARALAKTPLPATVVFASFTGEEAGLLGSREFVRLAAERKWRIAGALNNDMIGWAGESARMDNTIRFSNTGIRDIQHGAAILFSDLILYDAKYYKSTDAAAFYDGWGDIVGGIGSYPVLANPNYHQPTDLIETINFRQVAETAKVTAATIMYLASSPSRLKDVTATRVGSGVSVSWTPSPEAGVKSYIVAYGPESDPLKTKLTSTTSKVVLPSLPTGTVVAVKALNSRGLEGWDWARTQIK